MCLSEQYCIFCTRVEHFGMANIKKKIINSTKLLSVLLKLTWPHLNNTSRLASVKNVQQWIITDIQKDAVKVFTDLLRSYALWRNTTPLPSAPSNSVTGNDVTWCSCAASLFTITYAHAGVIRLISTTLTSVVVLRFTYSLYTTWIARIHSYLNPLNTELNPICHLLALLGAHHIFHVSGLRVKVIVRVVFTV